MTFSLRLLARSRRLRAMGMLAWLMLVINSLAAAPMGMTGGPHSHPMHATVAAVSEHCHHHVAVKASRSCCDDQAGCCGGMTGHTCNCAAMCSTTLPPGPAVALISTAITARYALPLPSSAPSLNTAPPLRPPAV
ncbi:MULTISPECIES: hypothetical protein [Rhodanobacter]|uniref:hypothetical protein n=1 Tax=Rhodanobacter TaxID=75309 RepID=UPI00128FF854|nr:MULTISPECIES: hypothetical protein [Rhodanobacter]UJJ58300.1 hypothetical protein LRK55_16880 [Rhodanobacter denitrificans]